MKVRICPKCNGNMKMLMCKTNPTASEWFCDACNKSVLATAEEIDDYIFALGAARQTRNIK